MSECTCYDFLSACYMYACLFCCFCLHVGQCSNKVKKAPPVRCKDLGPCRFCLGENCRYPGGAAKFHAAEIKAALKLQQLEAAGKQSQERVNTARRTGDASKLNKREKVSSCDSD